MAPCQRLAVSVVGTSRLVVAIRRTEEVKHVTSRCLLGARSGTALCELNTSTHLLVKATIVSISQISKLRLREAQNISIGFHR